MYNVVDKRVELSSEWNLFAKTTPNFKHTVMPQPNNVKKTSDERDIQLAL